MPIPQKWCHFLKGPFVFLLEQFQFQKPVLTILLGLGEELKFFLCKTSTELNVLQSTKPAVHLYSVEIKLRRRGKVI